MSKESRVVCRNNLEAFRPKHDHFNPRRSVWQDEGRGRRAHAPQTAASVSRHRGERRDERVRRAQIPHELPVAGDQPTPFPLGQGDIEGVVKAQAETCRDGDDEDAGAGDERPGVVAVGARREDVRRPNRELPGGDPPLPLRALPTSAGKMSGEISSWTPDR